MKRCIAMGRGWGAVGLAAGILLAGCDIQPWRIPTPPPQTGGGSPSVAGSKPAVATEEDFVPRYASCLVERDQRPIRLLNRSYAGFMVSAHCEDAVPPGVKSVLFLENEPNELYAVGHGTTLSVKTELRNGEIIWRFDSILKNAKTPKPLPRGSVDDFNEVMLTMPAMLDSRVSCLTSDRMTAMRIGDDALLRKQVGDAVQDRYWYVECWGKSWPEEGVLAFLPLTSEWRQPPHDKEISLRITGTYGQQSYLTALWLD